jgi:hypothetical protein
MEDRVSALDCGLQCSAISELTPNAVNAKGLQVRITLARVRVNLVAGLPKLAADGGSQESAAACHQSLHCSCSLAQRLSSSRRIFALCRTSTGKQG